MAKYVVEWDGKRREFSGADDRQNSIEAERFAESLDQPARVVRIVGDKATPWFWNESGRRYLKGESR